MSGRVAGALHEIPEPVVVALLRAGRRRHGDDHRPFANAAQLLEDDAGVRRCNDNSRAEVQNVRADSSHVRERLTRERLLSWLSGFFGVLAALLAAVGLYGVMSYSVARRSNEIAIRMALGAASGDVVRLMLGQAGLLLVVGLGIGCALALAIGRTAGTLLFGLQPNTPLSFAISVLALGIVALAAAYLPAARATRMSPLDGLRAD